MPVRALAVAAMALSAWVASAHAQAPARAKTPGELVMLSVNRSPELVPALEAALADARPEMRLTATRMIGVLKPAGFEPKLATAVAAETDERVRSEQHNAIERLAGRYVRSATGFAPRMRSATALYPGFLTSLLQASGCKPRTTRDYAPLRISYDQSGAPAGIQTQDGTPDACRKALAGLATVTYSATSIAPGEWEWIVLLLNEEAVACADLPLAPVHEASRPGRGGPAMPTKTRDVQPLYPADARQGRIAGLVVLRAVIAQTGCIRDITLMGPAHLSLDVAAFEAVSGWRYTHPTADGAPAAIRATMVVDFQLQ